MSTRVGGEGSTSRLIDVLDNFDGGFHLAPRAVNDIPPYRAYPVCERCRDLAC